MDTQEKKQTDQEINAEIQPETTTENLQQVLGDDTQAEAEMENTSIVEVPEEATLNIEQDSTVDEKPVVKRGRKKKEEVVEVETTESLPEEITVEGEAKEEPPVVKRSRKKKEDLSEIQTEEAAEASTPSAEEPKADTAPLAIASEVNNYTLTQLIEHTESVLENTNFSRVKEAMIVLKNRYEDIIKDIEQKQIALNTEEQELPMESTEQTNMSAQIDEFKKLLNKYSRLRKKHTELQEAEKLRNYDLKKQILEDLKQLVESEETLQKSWEDFKRLQQQWKEIGHVPPAQSQDLWNSFNHLVDLFLDKVKINRELRDLDYKKNLEAKMEICEKIEELLLVDSIENAFKHLGDLQNLWRETGPVPSEKREEINQRFGNAIEKLKEKRREMYEGYRVQLDQNLEVKKALIVKIQEINEDEITSAKAWGKKNDEVDELMKLWKSAGPVPKKHNEEIWAKFREEMSKFYAEKKEYFGKMKNELTENYNRKLLLCKQAESLQDSNDWKRTTQEIIALQNEWKTIGPVPHKYSEPIWKQFRAACDVYFNRKQDYFSNIDKNEEVNLNAKKEIIEQMLSFEFGEDNKSNLEAIKDFQRKFFEIGRVPIKEKDKIQSQFQKAVDELLDKLKIGKDEKRRFDMKQRYEGMSSSKTGQDDMRRESYGISSKISALESDIQLWENNIEFFAKSKNAEILTRDFRDKIEKAKAEVLVLKEKQKVLKGMM